ncbi:MAG: tetratricopeptide repeat protein [Candidatus Obscuribacterales bacterium]|jgi:tetratricopeptide (TPR) repeat protein
MLSIAEVAMRDETPIGAATSWVYSHSMSSHHTLAQVVSFVLIIAPFIFSAAAFAECEGPCAGQTNIAASNKLNRLGHREYDRRNFKSAADYYTRAIELNPRLTLAYAIRGDCYHLMGDCSRAIADFNKALELDPHDAFVLGNRAQEKLHLNDKTGALADFDAAISMGPTYFFMYSGRAQLRSELKDYTGAIADCNKALPMCPIASDLYVCRGKAFEALGKLAEAHRDLSKAIQLHPNDLYSHERRAYINFKLGNLCGAICDYIQARRKDYSLLAQTLLIAVFITGLSSPPTIFEHRPGLL